MHAFPDMLLKVLFYLCLGQVMSVSTLVFVAACTPLVIVLLVFFRGGSMSLSKMGIVLVLY